MPINIPLSPRFLLEMAAYLHAKQQIDSMEFTSAMTFTNAELKSHLAFLSPQDNTVLSPEQIADHEAYIMDYHRTAWAFDNENPEGVAGGWPAAKADEAAQKMGLTKDEYDAMFIFAANNGINAQQGGIFQLAFNVASTWLMQNGSIPLQQGVKVMSRDSNHSETFQVTTRGYLSEQDVEIGFGIVVSNPIQVEYYYEANVGKDSVSAAIDQNKYKFEVHEEVYLQFIRPPVVALLESKTPLKESDLYQIIPCLFDREIANKFASKLAQQKDNQPLIEKANHLVETAFAGQYKEMEKISRIFAKYSVDHYLKPIAELNQACDRYEAYLQKKLEKLDSPTHALDQQKLEQVQTLRANCLRNSYVVDNKTASKSAHIVDNKTKIEKFERQFNLPETKSILSAGADTTEKRLLQAIGHVLATAFTLGVYAAGMAIYSHQTRGSGKFWKSSDEIFQEKGEDAINKINKPNSRNNR